MAKKINEDSMSALFNGLTKHDNTAIAPAEGSVNTRRKEEKDTSFERERLCTLVESEVLSKVRAIADKEGISIASMTNLGLKIILENYEKNHGKVNGKLGKKKGKIDEVFDI